MGIANVSIEALGVGIDFFVKRDARKKSEGTFGPGWQMQADKYSDQKPFFRRGGQDGKYQKLEDDQLEKLDSFGDEIDGGLSTQKDQK
jgi:hypothetical protein